MFRFVLLVLALPFVLLGAEGLYNATRARQQATLTCEQYARGERPSLLLRITGCEIDYSGAAYRDSGGQIRELFFPARPEGRGGAATLVAATTSRAALQLAQAALGHQRQPPVEESTAAMQKAAAAAGASGEIAGLIRSGVLQQFASQRVLSGISVPLADNVSILDLQGQPDFVFPVLQIVGGLLLLGAGFLMGRQRPVVAEPDSTDRAEVLARLHKHTEALRLAEERTAASASAPGTLPIAKPEERADLKHRRPVEEPVRGRAVPLDRLPAIMLLNVGRAASAADLESAPPLGPRREVIARLRKVLPELDVDPFGRWRRDGPDHSLQLDLGADEIVHTVVLEAAGHAGVGVVRALVESTGWRAFVPKRGRFLDTEALEPVHDHTVTLR